MCRVYLSLVKHAETNVVALAYLAANGTINKVTSERSSRMNSEAYCLNSAKCCKTYWKLPHNANEEWASVYFKSNPGNRGTWHLLLPIGSRLQAVIHCYLDTMMYRSHPSFLIFCFWFSSAKYFVPQGEISLTTGTTRATYMGTHTQWDKEKKLSE